MRRTKHAHSRSTHSSTVVVDMQLAHIAQIAHLFLDGIIERSNLKTPHTKTSKRHVHEELVNALQGLATFVYYCIDQSPSAAIETTAKQLHLERHELDVIVARVIRERLLALRLVHTPHTYETLTTPQAKGSTTQQE